MILYYVKLPIQLVGQCRVVRAIFLQGFLPLWPRPRSFALLLHRWCTVIEYLTSRKEKKIPTFVSIRYFYK